MKKIDLHQDIILTFEKNPQTFFADEGRELLPDYNAGIFSDYSDTFELVFGAIWPYACEGDMQDVHNRTISFNPKCIDGLLDAYLSRGDKIPIIKTKGDLMKLGCKLLIHLEGHDTLGSVDELKGLFDRGVRSFGWTWNHDTTLSGANGSEKGLTPLGYQILEAMNQWGMIIDTAHMSRQGMRELLQNSKKPLLNSHSNVYTLHEHNRNIPDDILDLFPINGGVIGVSIYQPFISANAEVMMDEYLNQIEYIINRIGDDHIGLGTDWHGIPKSKAAKGLENVTGVHQLYARMLDKFGSVTTEKFFSGNALRVIETNLS